MSIDHISDTARWVATYRAMETERPDAIFRDPFARRLAGPGGQRIVDTIRKGKSRAWAMIVRTAALDEMILQAIAEGVDTVINLAAGLDARPWRLPLPSTLHWVDVDLPGILHYKADTLRGDTSGCRYEAVAADLTDAAVRVETLARVCADAGNALVVSEGLLIYLTAEQVGALARDLAAQPAARQWIFDLANPFLLAIMRKDWGREVQGGNAPFQFAPAEGTAFFEPFGWREKVIRFAIEEARRLRREAPEAWLWKLLLPITPKKRREEIRRTASYVLLERAAP